jgi:hypothetical protein
VPIECCYSGDDNITLVEIIDLLFPVEGGYKSCVNKMIAKVSQSSCSSDAPSARGHTPIL